MKISPQSIAIVTAAVLLGSNTPVHGCSRVLQNKYDHIISGRSMDWGFSFEDVLFLNPPGQEMDGGAGDMSVKWTSKYGSVSSSIIGFFAGFGDLAKELQTGLEPGEGCEELVYEKDGGSDGLNSEGLGVHLLYLGEEDGTVYNPENTTAPVNIDVMRWVRYVLDNFATVEEAVEGLGKLNTMYNPFCKGLEITDGEGKVLGVHMAMEDATGDSAIVEHVDGKFQFYHSKSEALVMTNEPPYDQQKEILAKYDFMGGNITLPDNLPGTVDSVDRMIRLEYYLTTSPEPKTEAESIAFIRSLISSSNVPFGAPYGGGVYPTWWASFIDLTDKVYYFDWLMTPNVIWIDQGEFDWEDIPETLTLKPQDAELVGNVLCDFKTLDGEDPKLDMCAEEVSTLATSGGKAKMTALFAVGATVSSFLALLIV